jgi:hypothetical protein
MASGTEMRHSGEVRDMEGRPRAALFRKQGVAVASCFSLPLGEGEKSRVAEDFTELIPYAPKQLHIAAGRLNRHRIDRLESRQG